MKINTTYNMDALEATKLLPDQCVDCIVTSPPYYGLRDYGTATWKGGNPACDHKGQPMRTRTKINHNCGTGKDLKNAIGYEPYKSVCGKCGAVRVDKQIGLEESPEQYIAKLVLLFRELRRCLKDKGTLWLNIGDSYAGSGRGAGDTKRSSAKQNSNSGRWVGDIHKAFTNEDIKPKDLIGIPWMLAFALRADGWYLRQDIIWAKTSCMPESVKDRCTKSHEYIFLFSKSPKYYFDSLGIAEKATTYDNAQRDRDHTKLNNTPGRKKMGGLVNNKYSTRNKRSVWIVSPRPFKDAHFATYPEELIKP